MILRGYDAGYICDLPADEEAVNRAYHIFTEKLVAVECLIGYDLGAELQGEQVLHEENIRPIIHEHLSALVTFNR